MTMTSLRKVLVSCLLFSATTALAVETFKVPVPRLRVYSQASTLSPVIITLSEGQTVQAGSNPAGGFKKVLVTDSSGKKKIGYVAISDLGGAKSSSQKSSSSRRRSGGAGLHNSYAVGLIGGAAYDTGTKSFTDASNNTPSGSLSGIAPEFGAIFIYPWSTRFNLGGYLMYKSSSLTGTATYTLLGATISANETINQTFISAGVVGQYYLRDNGSFWFGPGVQLDYGMSATATFGATTYTLSTNQFILLYAAAGYDLSLTDKIVLTPSINIGGAVNASPITIEANFLVSGVYKF